MLLSGGYVVDLGANVISRLLEWAEDRRVESLLERRNAPNIDVFIVCRAEKHALDDLQSLVRTIASGKAVKAFRIFVVLNEASGSFKGTDTEQELRRAFPDRELTFITLPKCQSEIWSAMERQGISLERVLEMDEDEVCATLDVDLWTASAGLAELNSWFEYVTRLFRQADVFGRRDVAPLRQVR